MKSVDVVIRNEEGLHAKPASLFSKEAAKYACDISLTKNGQPKKYNPKRIISLLSMGVVKGDKLTIEADGDGEEVAIANLKKLIESFK